MATTLRFQLRYDLFQIGENDNMTTQLCQKCRQVHPGRVCDYDEKGECAETISVSEIAQTRDEPSKDEEDGGIIPRPPSPS